MVKKRSKSKSEAGEILEIVNFIKDRMATNADTNSIEARMATKDDMATGFLRIEERLYSIEQELKDIKRRLAKLEDSYQAVKEYGADIRELQSRVRALEKQLASRR